MASSNKVLSPYNSPLLGIHAPELEMKRQNCATFGICSVDRASQRSFRTDVQDATIPLGPSEYRAGRSSQLFPVHFH
ncbi:unnamed protein product [Periconia digitata]|uniref:Uncharacterized protein n=1 Tax=Periconia digitata TaxID=1303443 RepID=A0A9W4UNZ9_9PLEO|nr:unnamed protein product [Periconia digitata]